MLRCYIALLAAITPLAAADIVHVTGGSLEGTRGTDSSVRVFKGVSYARAPVGEFRWKAPGPVAAWTGERKADTFGAVCVQAEYPKTSPYYQPITNMSEDCLTLNVWTAAKSAGEKRPVMVWIHGGALTRGTGSTPTYDGEVLAKKGVVVVTINYRLGIFGFFAHPELTEESDRNSSGHYGMLDQIAALEWVKKNAPAFGGDPDNVTIFGESAGSWSVNYLMATPLAKGLFHRVIGESGATFTAMTSLAESEKDGVRLAAGASLKELRARPADDLLKIAGAGRFRPSVDGWALPTDIRTIFASGKQSDVPLLAGFNQDEGTTLAPWPTTGNLAMFEQRLKTTFPGKADAAMKAYPATSDEEAKASYYSMFRDTAFGWNMRTWVRLQTKTGKSPAFLYYFTRTPPGSEALGAFHASEIAYVFGNLSARRQWEEADRKLSATMADYWTNFAKTGNPNGKGLPLWPAYKESTDVALELGVKVQERPALHKTALDFLDGINVASGTK
jgi:para-nitrobenzyl esterase